MPSKYMKELSKLEGAVIRENDPFLEVLQFSSPGLGYVIGPRAFGIPRGATALLFGPPKAGKTVLLNDLIAQVHKDYPVGEVIKFDTEFREEYQLTPPMMKELGIDPDRLMTYSVNDPALIFDRIQQEVVPQCEAGMPLMLVIIDSIKGVQGIRTGDADSVKNLQIGDQARTLGEGFKRILALQRKYRFAVVLTDQVRVEMDQGERMRGNDLKMSAALAVQHYAEYFIFVEPWKSKDGRQDLLGNDFKDEDIVDAAGKGEQTAHKLRITMKNSSIGPKGRTAIVTLSDRGTPRIVNRHEELFLIACGVDAIEKPNQQTYKFGEQTWRGKEAMLKALESDPRLCGSVWNKIKELDLGRNAAIGESPVASTISVE